jgi:hypothetical protein
MRRIARIAIAAAFAAAAAGAIRWWLEREAGAAPELPRRAPVDEQATSRNGSSPSGPTKDQLYGEARRLDIQGRSKMNKQELQEAVEAAKTGGAP